MRFFSLLLSVCTLLSAQPSVNFQWVNPLPTGIDIRDAKVFSADTFYIVGDAGSFLRTYDAGKTWFRHTNILGTSSRINALSFINKDTGWVCTDSGRIYRTVDAGVTFTSQLSNHPYPLYDIFMVDKDRGWACSDSGTIFRTDNGGGKWSKLSIDFDGSLYSVTFKDRDTGFVCGDRGYLYRSRDGGIQWGMVSANTINALRRMDMKRDTIVIAGLNGTIVVSSNGGLTFSPVTSPAAGGAFYSVAYAGNGTIYTGSNSGKGFRSTNLGSSWTQLASNTNSLNWLFASDFIAPRTGIIAGRAGTILTPHPTNDSLRINERITSETFRTVQNITGSSNVYAAGLGGIAFKSTNNGATWTPLTLPSGLATISAMAFTSSVKGVMVGASGKINYTTDGGKTWTPYTIGTARYWGVDIKGNYGFAGNSDGNIVRTTNGGASWTNYSSVGNKYIYSVDVLNDSVAFVSTGLSENSVYRSTDYGMTWEPLLTTDIASLFSVQFANDSVGFTAGQKGQFFFTKDGGKNWTKVPLDTTIDYFCIDITNFPYGLMSGTNGRITGFTMTDSLPVVYDIPSGTQSSLYSISATKNILDAGFTAYAAGANGNILRHYVSTNSAGPVRSVPDNFSLGQNFPNPFNPSTTIRFALRERARVTIDVFDLLGRKVATIAEQEYAAGQHDVQWNAADQSSGVYFYTMRSGAMSITKKALLVR